MIEVVVLGYCGMSAQQTYNSVRMLNQCSDILPMLVPAENNFLFRNAERK